MAQLAYYQKYLDRIDLCLDIRNNPDLARLAGNYLLQVVAEYRKLEYSVYHFDGFFLTFFENLQSLTYEGRVEEILSTANNFFNDGIHNELQQLSYKLDRLIAIYQNSDDNGLKTKISEFLANVNSSTYFTSQYIDECKNYTQFLINEHNYTPTSSNTKVVEKKAAGGCIVALILIIPNLFYHLFKQLISW